MSIAQTITRNGFKGEPVQVILKGSPKGFRAMVYGSLIEDKLSINKETKEVYAERLIQGRVRNEKICIKQKADLSSNQIEELLDKLVKDFREPNDFLDLSYTTMTIQDQDGNTYFTECDGIVNIDKVMQEVGLNLDQPDPSGPRFEMDKSSM